MKLPLWRLLTGWAILLTLCGVLAELAPVYLANYRLQGYLRENAGDPAVVQKLLAKAGELALPVAEGDVTVTATRVEIRYAVRKDFRLYQVDLHFHPSAKR